MNYSEEDINRKCNKIIEEKDNTINILILAPEIIKDILNNYYIIENINKPINALSYYKLSDLIEISKN